MQSVVIKGNLTRDPELKTISSANGDVEVVNFTIAESRKFTKKDGTKHEETTYIDCEAWAAGARLIDQLMSKGDPILVTGTLKLDTWEKDGQKHSKLKLRVDNFDKLFRKSNGDSTQSTQATPATSGETTSAVSKPVAVGTADGEIPF